MMKIKGSYLYFALLASYAKYVAKFEGIAKSQEKR